MNFHLEFTPRPFDFKLNLRHRLLLVGSCFTEQIGNKLSSHKFQTISNPHGILFNPISIAQSLQSYLEEKQYRSTDLFFHNELWGSWDHHTRFSNINAEACLQKINQSRSEAAAFIPTTDWVLVTLGSSFVYEQLEGRVVANCHKVPTDKFTKKLLSAETIKTTLQSTIQLLHKKNPSARIIFTISPVRHLREGFVENNRSKANLITAVHELVSANNQVYYFPAYELVIDDLRDYRFYAEDMVHPNHAATNYVWEKFIAMCIDEPSQQLMKDVSVINAARLHKPFNPSSHAHQSFLRNHLQKALELKKQHEFLDLKEEIDFFEREIKT